MEQEITHIAVIQIGGLVATDAVESNAFASYEDALAWVKSEIDDIHGDVKVTTHDDGKPLEAVVTSSEGPSIGFIIRPYPRYL